MAGVWIHKHTLESPPPEQGCFPQPTVFRLLPRRAAVASTTPTTITVILFPSAIVVDCADCSFDGARREGRRVLVEENTNARKESTGIHDFGWI